MQILIQVLQNTDMQCKTMGYKREKVCFQRKLGKTVSFELYSKGQNGTIVYVYTYIRDEGLLKGTKYTKQQKSPVLCDVSK